MVSIEAAGFAALLRQYRLAAGLSQQALAERAGLSAHAVSALERGARRVPYRATLEALAEGLGLSDAEQAALEATVPRVRGPRGVAGLTAGPALGGVPLPPMPLFGRADELKTVQELLRSDAVRLLTITGPAGVGKTRLTLEVARELRPAFPDGVWFVDLAPLRDPELVVYTVAQVLDVHERVRQSLLATLEASLRERQLLVVLDNFEQVLAAAPQLAELLAACPGLKLLVTSRTRLRLRWEHIVPLLPLAVADPEMPPTVENLAAVPAVALFVERAQRSDPTFALTPENTAAVAALCRHLEGLPLALELAAARANVLAPAEMLAWAEQRLPVLSLDAPDLPTRQRSLRATLAWSSALLPAEDQALFRRLAVFAGGWTREAADAVTGMRELGLDPVEGLSRLSDASLVQVRQREDEGLRFSLLETVRELAWEQLEASGEQAALERQHAAYYLALAERAAPALEGAAQRAWFRRLEREHANLRGALGWAAQQGEAESELRLAASLASFWHYNGHLGEGRAWLEDALTRNPDRRDGVRQVALEGVGLLMLCLGEDAAGAARLEEALALARALGEDHRIARALGALMHVAYNQGQTERWPALAAELEAARAGAIVGNLNLGLHVLGMLVHEAGEHAKASAYLEEALAVDRRAGNKTGVALALACLAVVARAQGDRARALGLVTEAIQHARELGYPTAITWGPDLATCTLHDAVPWRGVRLTAIKGAAYAAVRVSAEWAPAVALTRVFGAIDPLGARATFVLSPSQQEWCGQTVAALRAALGEEAFAAAWAAGRGLSLDQLAEEALAALAARPSTDGELQSPPRPPCTNGLLSPREHEVLELVAAGLTNKQIAERLVITEGTARFHVTSLLNKLGADNRTQAVASAREQSLL
ncbi:MAG TPA: LuxR C-terminal-related transcriptional regulator [Candidatus Limnocylindria bacterium]